MIRAREDGGRLDARLFGSSRPTFAFPLLFELVLLTGITLTPSNVNADLLIEFGFGQALLLATETPSVASNFTAEEAQTASVLLHDFQKSGIHLPPADRALFVDLSEKVIGLGRQFSTNIASPPRSALAALSVSFPDASVLKPGLGESFVKRVKNGRRGGATVDAASWEGMMVLRKAEDEGARKRVWMAGQGGGEVGGERVHVLEELLATRAKLAGLVGRGSWGEVELENKMAKKPGKSTSDAKYFHSARAQAFCNRCSFRYRLCRRKRCG